VGRVHGHIHPPSCGGHSKTEFGIWDFLYCGEDGTSTRGEFEGWSEIRDGFAIPKGKRKREGGSDRKERKGWSEAAGTRAKGDELLFFDSELHLWLGQERGFIYMYSHVVKGGSRVSAAGDRPRGVVTIGGDELNGLWSIRRCVQGRRGEEQSCAAR